MLCIFKSYALWLLKHSFR